MCCFPAVLLVQGIIAKMQTGTAVQSQQGSSSMPELVHTAGVGVWDRGTLRALIKSPLVHLPYWLHQTWYWLSFISFLFNSFVYLRYPHPPYLWSADERFLSETRLDFEESYQLMFGEEMLFLSKKPNFQVFRTLKQQWVVPASTVRATSKVFFCAFLQIRKSLWRLSAKLCQGI